MEGGQAQSGLSLGDFLNLPVADAGCADAHPPRGTVHQSAHGLQIQIPASLGDIVRVADSVAELGSPAANFTNFCHKTEISLMDRRINYIRAVYVPATAAHPPDQPPAAAWACPAGTACGENVSFPAARS